MNNRYLYNLCKKKMNTECEESQKALLNSLFITRRYFNEIIIVMFILHHLAKNQTNLIELYCIVSYPSHFLYFIFDMESIMMRIRLPYKYCDTYKFCYEWDPPPPQRVRSPVNNEMNILSYQRQNRKSNVFSWIRFTYLD